MNLGWGVTEHDSRAPDLLKRLMEGLGIPGRDITDPYFDNPLNAGKRSETVLESAAETDSPTGTPVILLNRKLNDAEGAVPGSLQVNLIGESLHNLKHVEPERFHRMLSTALKDPEFNELGLRSYAMVTGEIPYPDGHFQPEETREKRDFLSWMTHSRFDQILSGYIFAGDPRSTTLKEWSRDWAGFSGEAFRKELDALDADLGHPAKGHRAAGPR